MSERAVKYQLGSAENREFLRENAEDLLRFGVRFPSEGGGSYYLGDDGTPWKERPRETWITARMVHVYSMAHMMGIALPEKPGAPADAGLAARLAAKGLQGLKGELHDEKNGGWYPGVTADGEPLPDKQCYAHAFVILAASSAMLAGIPGAEELLKEALETYDKRFWNEEEGLSCDSWNTEFTVCDSYRGLNANMHTVEAFLAAADACRDETYRVRAGRIIDHVAAWASGNSWRIPEHFSEDWTPDLACNKDKPDDPFKPYGATPGHGCEWARLIVQWALSTYGGGSEKAAPYIEAGEKLFCRAISDGWSCDGGRGIVYTTDWDGKPVVHDRMFWVLAEAINTASVLYRVTGKKEYADRYAEFMEYLDECVIDHEKGSWLHQLDKDARVMTTVWPGKSDIDHAFQAMTIPCSDVQVSIASAVLKEAKIKKLKERFLFRDVREADAEEAAEIEKICFPPNEACSPERIRERTQKAPETFLVAEDRSSGKLVGFLNGLASEGDKFHDGFFTDISLHCPEGKNVMLLGLDVLPEYRGQGLATAIVEEYRRRQKAAGRKRLLLTCLREKEPMYAHLGFCNRGPADSTWGGEAWTLMDIIL